MHLRLLFAKLLALVVTIACVWVGWALPVAHAAVPPGQLDVAITTSDGGEVDGTAYLYRWDTDFEEFGYEAELPVTGVATANASFPGLAPGSYYVQVDDDFGNYLTGYSGGAVDDPVSLSDPGVVTLTAEAGGATSVVMNPVPPPVSVSGSVVDATTDEGIVDAYVEASGDQGSDDDFTAVGGTFALDLPPGTYDVAASADGYVSTSVELVVTAESTTMPAIELTPLTPGIYVSVHDDTFGGPVADASVNLAPVGGGMPTTVVTDADGEAVFVGVPNGDYTVSVVPATGYVAGDPAFVSYSGGVEYAELSVSVDLSCEPTSASTGLTNVGFEEDLAGWTVGYTTEGVAVVGADDFTQPWEGSKMLRIGNSQPSNGEDQPEGPNVLCQDFVVDQAQETFSFNAFTYDYTGFDEFMFDVVVTDPDTGETLAAYQQGAWGEGTELKTSGWRGVKLDLTGHVGDTVRLSFRAGGTSDTLYAFWAYVDSADTLPPTIQTSTADVKSATGSVTTDPVTGQVTVAMPSGSPSDLTLTIPATCADEEVEPTSVSLVLGGEVFDATKNANGTYTATIPEESIESGSLSVQVMCPDATTLVVPIGQIVLYDPSGIVTDKVTGQPVVGAEVRLYKVPGWEPQGATGPHPASTCQTNLSKAGGAPWSQPAPTDLGVLVQAASPEISPNVNPFVTNAVGYYGWDVAQGCWYVVVSKAGYQTLTSPVVGVPTAVTDLDLQLVPNPTGPQGPSAGCTAAQAGLSTAQAAIADAQAKVKKAKAKLKKAKKSGSAAKVKKAKAKLKKAKTALGGASSWLATAQANVGKHC
ncbi:DUF1090 family protein [Pimelobacter simplex]|uniref:DUF1090 family protein n=1 Tax=Nocardioides simplex TaxID=2045 RepID=UPI001934995E|nr:DUF1090 family protein [Pimelobacter simplex]